MSVDPRIQSATISAARGMGLDPALLMAVIEIESNFKAFEVDGSTPQLLFERHIFYRRLKAQKPELLQKAVDEGLTREKWDRATQYKDQGTSKGRLALIQLARSIDEEIANQSASWGLGQTMGFNATMVGYTTATLMVRAMAAPSAQIDGMIREIRRSNNLDNLRNKNWAAFARIYNGAGYAANHYDTRLATAFEKWSKALDALDDSITPTEAANEPPPPQTRQAEPPSMTKSTVGNGTIAAGGSVLGGTGLVIGGHIVDHATEKAQAGADKIVDHVFNTPMLLGIVLLAVALAAMGYVWYRRYQMKKESGV